MRHRTPIANNIIAIRRAIEEAGVRLLFDAKGEPAGIARADVGGELFFGPP